MHNGGIADFPLIKRKLQVNLSDEVFNVVQGNTGEDFGFEWICILWLCCSDRFWMGICSLLVEGRPNFILCKMLVHNDHLSFRTPMPEISLSIYWSRLCLRRYPLSTILQRRQVSLKYVSFSEISWDNSNIGIAKSYEFLCHRWRKRHRHTIYIFPTGWGCFLGLSTFCTLPWLWLI